MTYLRSALIVRLYLCENVLLTPRCVCQRVEDGVVQCGASDACTPVRACSLYLARLRVVHCAVVGAAAYQKVQ